VADDPRRQRQPREWFALGVGLSTRADAAELTELVDATLRSVNVPRDRVRVVATVDTRADHPAVAALGWPVVTFPAEQLAGRGRATPGPGTAAASGAAPGPVAEPAALLAAGPGAELVVPKRRSARATVAMARAERAREAHTPSGVRRPTS
jgi:cobalamin biosynthesis protein CbiG